MGAPQRAVPIARGPISAMSPTIPPRTLQDPSVTRTITRHPSAWRSDSCRKRKSALDYDDNVLSQSMSLERVNLVGYFTTDTNEAWSTVGHDKFVQISPPRHEGCLANRIEHFIIHGGPCPFHA
jgi:hypothetical protein